MWGRFVHDALPLEAIYGIELPSIVQPVFGLDT
jgi:hypothetical protein